jgi:WD40 repeat protein
LRRTIAEVFISYSRKDKEFVQKLVAALVAEEREVWLDERNIEPTAEWLKEIFDNIEAADNFIFVISPDSVVSTYARREIDHAALNNKRIVPIFYRAVPDHEVPEAVAKFQRIDFSGTDGFYSNFATLIAALNTDLEWKQTHTRLLTRAKEWERKGKDRSFLLRGKDLSEAEQWLAKSAEKHPQPTTLQSQYILASRQAATRLHRTIIGAVSVAFLIAVGLAIYAFRQTAVARAGQFVAGSISSEDTDPELSVLFAAQAAAATWPWGHRVLPEAEAELHRAVMASHVKLTLRGHDGPVSSVAWSPDGKRLATASYDKTGKVWDVASGQEVLTLIGQNEDLSSMAWSPNGKLLATASYDKTGKVWDAASGQEVITLRGHNGPVYSVAWSPDGTRLATASTDATAKVWDAASGQEVLTLRGHVAYVNSVAWSPDGKQLATASDDHTAKVWDAASGREMLTLRGHSSRVTSVAWSPDGKQLATASQDATTKVWDAASGQEVLILHGHNPSVTSVAWSPDGKQLATASDDRTAKLWDATSGREVLTLRGHNGPVYSVAWSSDGKRLATASDDHTAKLWDTASGREVLTLRGHNGPVNSVAWSPDGKQLATASSDHTAKVWDAASGMEVLTLRHKYGVNSVAWSPDGKRLATATDDKVGKVWDAASGQEVLTLRGHNGPVSSVAWSPAKIFLGPSTKKVFSRGLSGKREVANVSASASCTTSSLGDQ